MKTGFQKMMENNTRFWKDWMEKSSAWPRLNSPNQWWAQNYSPWLNQWFRLWDNSRGIAGGSEEYPTSLITLRKSMLGLLESYPADQWCNMLSSYNQQLENYINIVDDIDLPIDEMAASWEKMLEVFTPKENLSFSILGESANKYLEMMIYPLYGIVELPQIMAHLKLWYTVQFYSLSFLIRNIELRGKVLEATLAAWPETLKECNEQFEQDGAPPSVIDFYEKFFSRLEKELYTLMKSTDYIQVQEKIVETMVTLKSQLNKWFEIGTSSLPLATQSDLNDIAYEIEALRVKIRKMGEDKSPIPSKKLKREVSN